MSDERSHLLQNHGDNERENSSSSVERNGSKHTDHLPPRAFPFLKDEKGAPKWIRRQRWATMSFSAVVSSLVALIGVLAAYKATRGFGREPRHKTACDLDTSTSLHVAFQIDARLIENLSFPGAKAVSVLSDFVFGQMGRLILGGIAWRVMGDALTTIMESSPVSYELYTSVTLSTISFASLWTYVKAVTRQKSRANHWVLVGFVYVTLWAFFWPTIISASMGYVSNTVGYLNLTDGSLVDPASTKTRPCFSVPDGPRIGLPENATLVSDLPACLLPTEKWYKGLDMDDYGCGREGTPNEDSIAYQVEQYYDISYSSLKDYYPDKFDHTNITGSWNSTLYPNKTLEINGVEFIASSPLLEVGYRRCFNGTQVRHWQPSSGSSPPSSLWNCVQVNGYNWGLSTTMFLFTGPGMLLWVVCVFCLFLWANKNGSMVGNGGNRRGVHRTIADMSESLGHDLGPDACTYKEEELRKWLADREVKYYTDDGNRDVAHFGMSGWKLENVNLQQDKVYGRE